MIAEWQFIQLKNLGYVKPVIIYFVWREQQSFESHRLMSIRKYSFQQYPGRLCHQRMAGHISDGCP